MDLDNGLSALFSWQLLLFCCGVAIVVFVFRTLLENFVPSVLKSTKYDRVFLPLFPPAVGVVIAFFATSYAYPNGMNTLSDRIIFGLVSGAFSSLVYRVVKGAFTQKILAEITQVTTTTTQYPQPYPPPPYLPPPGPPCPPDPTQPPVPVDVPALPTTVVSSSTTVVSNQTIDAVKKP